MSVNWNEIQKELSPIKNFEDLQRRLRVSLGFPCVRQAFNFREGLRPDDYRLPKRFEQPRRAHVRRAAAFACRRWATAPER